LTRGKKIPSEKAENFTATKEIPKKEKGEQEKDLSSRHSLIGRKKPVKKRKKNSASPPGPPKKSSSSASGKRSGGRSRKEGSSSLRREETRCRKRSAKREVL